MGARAPMEDQAWKAADTPHLSQERKRRLGERQTEVGGCRATGKGRGVLETPRIMPF